MTDAPHDIDVERLVGELRERIERRRAAGGFDDLEGLELELEPDAAPVRFRPELAYSTKRGLGRPLTLVKQLLLRLLVHVFDDLARQTSDGLRRVEALVEASSQQSRAAIEAESTARTRVATDVQAVLGRIEALERLEAGVRIARLERGVARPAAATTTAAAAASALGAAAAAPPGGSAIPMDYPAFKARFGGSPEEIRERQAGYLDALIGRARVVDLGCGHGELLASLRENGVPAYGVETEPDFVARLLEEGLEVVSEDGIGHLRGLPEGAVDGIVASHLVEHLPPEVMIDLIVTAHDRLAPGGVLVMDTPNPESLVAGSVSFHRDPTHLKPVHPDTLAFLCEMAGFSRVEIRRLSPAPPERLPPRGGGGEGAVADRLDDVVERLNALLFGHLDYAVLAWRRA
jgi:SAM-dependent methyltransferase